jgi:glycosyltransferase involved in cell wall biosynthesis
MHDSQCDLTVVGRVQMADGIGRQAVELIQCLENDLEISFVPLNSFGVSSLGRVGKKTRQFLADSGRTHPGKVLIFEEILKLPPRDGTAPQDFWQKYQLPPLDDTQVRVAYSMFESSRIPSEWVGILNQHFDAVIVPDVFLVEVYKNSGVKIPIFVIPLGLDLSSFLERPLKAKAGKPMVFANFGTCIARKNQVVLVKAFAQAFGDNPDVQLLLGWKSGYSLYARDVERELANYNLHNVRLEKGGVDRSRYVQRFCNIDCYVSLSKGEGFSIQPREAMALGIPTIVTNSTGQRTICSCDAVRTVPAPLRPPAAYSFFTGVFGVYEDCTVADAAEALRDVYNNYEKYLKTAELRRNWVASCSYENLRHAYLCMLKPKEIRLGACDKLTKTGIMTSNKKFAEKIARVLALKVQN